MLEPLLGLLVQELPAVPIYLGAAGLDQHASPPRIVVVPEGERLEPPTAMSWPKTEGQVLYTRRVELSLYLWASSYADVEGMLDEVLTALRKRLGPIAQPRGGEWIEGGAIALGVAYRLRLEVVTPVQMRERYVTLESLALQCQVGG